MAIDGKEYLWVEKYRPKKIKETILPLHLKTTFQNFVEQKNVPNLLLVGGAGVGKTTVAKAMLEEIGADYIMINGSLDGNKDALRTDILHFASSVSFSGGRKYVILDEADYLTHHVQPALRNFMEEHSKNCGFILTCNFPNKIIQPLHSRCSVIEFRIDNKQKAKLASSFYKRCIEIFKKENVEFDQNVVAEVIKMYFPDWRRILNEFQRYSTSGKIDTGILATFQEFDIEKLVNFLKEKDFTNTRKWVAEHSDIDSQELFSKFYKMASEKLKSAAAVAQLVVLLGKYQYQATFVGNQEINNAAFFAETMIQLNGEWI